MESYAKCIEPRLKTSNNLIWENRNEALNLVAIGINNFASGESIRCLIDSGLLSGLSSCQLAKE